jgi:arsenate reductase
VITTRLAKPEDAAALATVYNQGIEDRVATFETRPRTAEELAEWFDGSKIVLVAEDGSKVVGGAWTSPTSARCVYSRNVDASVYVAREARRRGVGDALLRALIDEARRQGKWKIIAGIFPENTASLRLFHSQGFRDIGRHEAHGQLDGVFRDVVLVERIVAPTVLFACVHNAGRSQMAAAWFRRLADPAKARALSAGTQPGPAVHPEVVVAMREVGIDLSAESPRRLTDELARAATHLITMGCGEQCPVVPGVRYEDWPLEDPKGRAIERVREIRDEGKARVEDLLRREGWARGT